MSRRSAIPTVPLAVTTVGLFLAVVPLMQKVAPWALALFIGALAARFLINYFHAALPSLPVKVIVLTAGLAGISLSYGSLLGIEPGLGILLILVSLKLLETNTPRDFQVLTLLGWFLSLCVLFFAQDLLMWLYIGGICTLLVASLIAFHAGGSAAALKGSARIAFGMMAQTLPIVIVLFLLFPRTYGGFRFAFSRGLVGSTGMSDRVEPGAIATLAMSNETAFRADFPDGNAPSITQMYWRGMVLWDGNGLTWTRGPHLRAEIPSRILGGDAIRQRIILEPHGGVWLFGLDRPEARTEKNSYFEAGGYLVRDRPVMTQLRYGVTSRPDNQQTTLPRDQLAAGTTLPREVSPRTRALVESWRDAATDDRQFIEQALKWFRRENFVYTLSPGALGAAGMDSFLFRTQQGFCEHYAASFATLMRIGGVPSRLVIGYMGGEFNPHGNYVIVRQSDAHAWVEVWLKDSGWVRVDPTNVIAPERISSGVGSYLQSRDGNSSARAEPSTGMVGLRDLLRDARLAWDNLNYQWDLRVLNFDEETQRSFFALVGLQNFRWPAIFTWMGLASALTLSVIALWLRRSGSKSGDEVQRAYRCFCRLLARAGVQKEPNEGPIDLGRRAVARFPEAAEAIDEVTRTYVEQRYGRSSGSSKEFVRAVRALPRLRRVVQSQRPRDLEEEART